MKKIILYLITSITSLWIIDTLLSGYNFAGSPITFLLVDLFVVMGIYLTDWVASKAGKRSTLLFLIVGVLINFFSLYFASLFLGNFSVNAGSLQWLKIGFLQKMDQILSLLIGSLITVAISMTTRWATSGSKSE